MYSVVLAAMLTAGPTTPACGYSYGCYCYDPCVTWCAPACWGCGGCYGCWGCGGCYGCYGCYGGCYGCWSNCWGWGCGGCYSCYGCWGGWSTYSYWGGCWDGCWGIVYDVVPVVAVVQPVVPVKAVYGPAAGALPTQATVVVNLPADATLYVDGRRSNLTSSKRTILTPALDPAKEYTYTIKMEVLRNGRTVEQTKKISFSAGKVVAVKFAPAGAKAIERPEEQETASAFDVDAE